MSSAAKDVGAKERTVGLTIPAKSEFVGLARLAIGGLSRDLDIDEEIIEDMKVAISEVSNSIVNQAEGKEQASIHLEFSIDEERIVIEVGCSNKDLELAAFTPIVWSETPGNDMGLSIITALTDKVELDTTSADSTTLRLTKYLSV